MTLPKTVWNTAAAILFFGGLAAAAEVTRTPNLGGFDRVEARRAFEVEIHQGSSFHLELHADESVVSDLDVHVSGDRLVLDRRARSWHDGRVRAIITMPTLVEYEGSGASRTTISGFHAATPVKIVLSGASRLEADFEAGDTRLDLSGASKANLRGRGGALRINTSGASSADLTRFSAERADVRLSGASHATVNTHGRLDLQASGASHATHLGHPMMGTISTSGASSIHSAD